MHELQYKLEAIEKHVTLPSEELHILKNINLEIRQGDSLAIIGASGSGKSSLLNILGTLDTASSGNIYFENTNLASLNSDQKAQMRNKDIGFVFQFHHLLSEFNCEENVAMQAIIGGQSKTKALKLAREVLEKVGLSHRSKHSVTTLSGGEKQRAAIARAILNSPKVLLADEPTGNLDIQTGEKLADLLLDLNKNEQMTLVVVTHNHELASLMNRKFELRLGELYEENRT